MRAVILAVLLFVAVACGARPKWYELEEYTFARYEKDFKKHYGTEKERAMRQSIFEERLLEIKSHNKIPGITWHKGVNHLTDLTNAERDGMRGTWANDVSKDLGKAHVKTHVRSGRTLPKFVDHRTTFPPVLTAVKDQGFCGSCWAHAATEAIESAYAAATGELYVLSQQQIVSCTPNPKECGGTGGCGGNIAEQAFDYIRNTTTGISEEWTYPYMSYFGNSHTCRPQNDNHTIGFVNISGYTRVGPNSDEDLMDALATVGPLAISVDASQWPDYEGGIFTNCSYARNISMDHAVQAVGYGHDFGLGMDYWIVRNSWNAGWGENGFIRLHRQNSTTGQTCGWNVDNQNGYGCKNGPSQIWVCGMCGIASDALYVNL